MDLAALDWTTGVVVAAIARDEAIDPLALMFLLRIYAATGSDELRDDLRQVLEPALARGLERGGHAVAADERARWLMLVAEAFDLSEDGRLPDAASTLIAALRGDWGKTVDVDLAAASVEGCLVAAHLVDPHAIVPPAIDELERIVASAYHVGEGLTGGRVAEHVRLASTLLTAYEITARLPYSMLAEELLQFIRRTNWSGDCGRFVEGGNDDLPSFVVNCDAARVFVRLAALHRSTEYRAGAVLAAGAAYDEDAARILDGLDGRYQDFGIMSAAYGLALMAYEELKILE
jgi:hypothetical protein